MLDINQTKKNILIVGYGISGKSVYLFLKKQGHNVYVFDDLESSNTVDFVKDINEIDIDLVVKSPSIHCQLPENCHPIIKKAFDKNIPVLSSFDIFQIYNPDAKIICITGTNGKSTTTALLYHILKKSGLKVSMGGNIGFPYFDLPKSDYYILEMSSYELESSQYLNFEIAAILNIEPDHIDFHGSYENYIAAKHKALDHGKLKIISNEDEFTFKKYKDCKNTIIISTKQQHPDSIFYIIENALFDQEEKKIVMDLSNFLQLKGEHNYQNILFAYVISKKLGLQPNLIASAISSFIPLPHRLNTVLKINNIVFVNDSKATNPGSAAKALATFAGYKIYWLVGGVSKNVDPIKYVSKYLDSVKKIYLFGESVQEFTKIFHEIKQTVNCQNMIKALLIAYKDACKENTGPAVILLSPMCASFDQFDNFEQRGDTFVESVKKLGKDL